MSITWQDILTELMKRISKAKYDKLEKLLNKKGIETPRQLRKIMVVERFLMKNPLVNISGVGSKELYQLTLDEFKTAFAKSALQLTEFKSANATANLLIGHYRMIIIEALKQNKDAISVEGINEIRFLSTSNTKIVRSYCKLKGINLHEL